MNYNIIPLLGSAEAAAEHENKEAWRAFSSRTTKNPFLKEFLRIREDNQCAWCNRTYPLHGFQVHHIDYDHECYYGKMIEIPNPTEKRPGRTSKIADCESCHRDRTDLFNDCAKRLTTVHNSCNRTIEIVRGKLNDGTLLRR